MPDIVEVLLAKEKIERGELTPEEIEHLSEKMSKVLSPNMPAILSSCDSWIKAWEIFKQLGIGIEESIDVEEYFEIPPYMWIDDFIDKLKEAVTENEKYLDVAEKVLKYLINYYEKIDEEEALASKSDLVEIYRKTGKYNKAIKLCREILNDNPEDFWTYIDYAYTLIGMNKYGDAEKIMEKCIENSIIEDFETAGDIYTELMEFGKDQISEKLRNYYNIREKITDITRDIVNEAMDSNNLSELMSKAAKILTLKRGGANNIYYDEDIDVNILMDFMIFGNIEGTKLIDNITNTINGNKYDKELIDALKKSKYSLFKIVSTHPKEHTLEIEDVFENKRYTVMDIMLSKSAIVGDFMTSRYVPLKDYGIIILAGYVFPKKYEYTIFRTLKKLMKKTKIDNEENKKFIVLYKLGKKLGYPLESTFVNS